MTDLLVWASPKFDFHIALDKTYRVERVASCGKLASLVMVETDADAVDGEMDH
jgi:hypothetical protein